MALLLCCLVVFVCVCVCPACGAGQCSRYGQIYSSFVVSLPSMGSQSQNIKTPSCLMDAHSIAMKNGHQQKSEDILWKIYRFQWMLTCFKLLFCNMKHVSASLEEIHQSAADRVDRNDRNIETCQCHATRLHASVHPHSERLLSICGSIKIPVFCFIKLHDQKNTSFPQYATVQSNWIELFCH